MAHVFMDNSGINHLTSQLSNYPIHKLSHQKETTARQQPAGRNMWESAFQVEGKGNYSDLLLPPAAVFSNEMIFLI
jgi:hypothetical protein